MAVNRVTEQKVARIIDTSNYENPIHLSWLGDDGDMRHWCFCGQLDETVMLKNEEVINKTVNNSSYWPYNIEWTESFQAVLSRDTEDTFEVYAPDVRDYYVTDADDGVVLNSEREYLRSLSRSPYVLMLLNPITWDTVIDSIPQFPKWMRVFVSGRSFSFGELGNSHYSLSFKIKKQPNLSLKL